MIPPSFSSVKRGCRTRGCPAQPPRLCPLLLLILGSTPPPLIPRRDSSRYSYGVFNVHACSRGRDLLRSEQRQRRCSESAGLRALSSDPVNFEGTSRVPWQSPLCRALHRQTETPSRASAGRINIQTLVVPLFKPKINTMC